MIPDTYKCLICRDTGMELYKKIAPSPPYKKGSYLDFGRPCKCTVRQANNYV